VLIDPDGKRVTVMGLGRFGGGVGAIRWLAGRGARVLVTDLDNAGTLAHSLAAIRPLIDSGTVRLALGGHVESDFTQTDLVVANAAVPTPWANPFLSAARAAGVPIVTEIGLVTALLPDRANVIGITGSVGKSTTTALIHHIFAALGIDSVAGGNIGGSLLTDLDQGRIATDTRVVLELSSAMLHWLSGWSPGTAVVTTFEDNHVDWHGTIDHYRTSKRNILANQRAGDRAVLGPTVHSWPTVPGVHCANIPADAGVDGLAIPGAHNAWNAAVAVAVVCATDAAISEHQARDAARTFKGLPHRLEFVGEIGRVRFFNDSKATTPGATLIGVSSFPAERTHLIAGGYDKRIDLSPISEQASTLAGLYTVGQTGPQLARAADAIAPGSAFECGTLDAAIERASDRARPGDVVLLSPGCASWDQFTNFEARGDLFRAWVAAHAAARSVP